jgi:uncharacterized protein (DUF1800 family)
LDMLAGSPATGNRLSYKLAHYFRCRRSTRRIGQITFSRKVTFEPYARQVLKTLFSSSEFWERRNYGTKFKTPYEYVISTTRAAGVPVVNVRSLASAMTSLGMPFYGCQTPDGYRQTQQAWLSPVGMMTRTKFRHRAWHRSAAVATPGQ